MNFQRNFDRNLRLILRNKFGNEGEGNEIYKTVELKLRDREYLGLLLNIYWLVFPILHVFGFAEHIKRVRGHMRKLNPFGS